MTKAFEKPFVTGVCRMWRRDCQPRSVIVVASSALPTAPAVVPRVGAPRPTAARSMIVATRLIPRMRFVFPTACRVVIRRRL